MNIKNYQSRSGLYAELLAFGSFAIGTLLLGLRILMPDNHRLILVGFFFVLAAVLVNVAALLILLYHCLARFEYRRYYGQRIFLLLCNIPVAWLYVYIALEIIH